jgi:hypothetical protein
LGVVIATMPQHAADSAAEPARPIQQDLALSRASKTPTCLVNRTIHMVGPDPKENIH